jgi:hypothetical protein
VNRRKGFSIWAHEPFLSEKEVGLFFAGVSAHREKAAAREAIENAMRQQVELAAQRARADVRLNDVARSGLGFGIKL